MFLHQYALVMTESLRVRNLLAMDALGTSLLAGNAGIDRVVLWAHSCEMPDPENWLGPNELLMTVGLCIPPDEAGQIEFIRRLDGARLAGVVIGDDQMAPSLSAGMIAEAERLGFPVMLTAHTVPFAVIGRTVAAVNSTTQTQQVLTLSRLYHVLINETGRPETFLISLERVFNVQMTVLDLSTRTTLLHGTLKLTQESINGLMDSIRIPLTNRTTRLETPGDLQLSTWALPSRRTTLLVLDERPGSILDAFTVTHLGQAVSVEADRHAARRLAEAEKASSILSAIYAGDVNLARLETEAMELGLDTADLSVLVTSNGDSDILRDTLSLTDIIHASGVRQDYLVTCLQTSDVDKASHQLLRHGKRIGVSNPFIGLSGFKEAALNAQWALGTVRDSVQGIIRYESAEFSVLPRSEGEANEVIRRVLGPLTNETTGATTLLETLCAYLDNERSWTATANALGIHKQTLAYRLQRIESLTGRNLKNTRDIAELWIARSALKRS